MPNLFFQDQQLLVASLGQAIMQHSRPRALLAPLQVAVGVQIHHLVESKFLVQQMHKLGFTTSYEEVQKFDKSAAVYQVMDNKLFFIYMYMYIDS